MAFILSVILYFSLLPLMILKEVTAESSLAFNDLGVHGAVFEIEEESLLEVMTKRLLALKESGKLEALQEQMVGDLKKRALAPKRIQDITKTTKKRVFSYDPTLQVSSDITIDKEVHGKEVVLARRGDKINPLDQVPLTRGLLFMDGEDPSHLNLMESFSKDFEIVLIAGNPIDLTQKLGIPIYFDQGGALTKRFGISHVPAKVEQAHKGARVLQITEFVP